MSTQTLIEHGPFIAGVAEPLAGAHREITNPGTGELVGRVTAATADDADRAVQELKALLEDNAPYQAKVTFEGGGGATGWNAPARTTA